MNQIYLFKYDCVSKMIHGGKKASCNQIWTELYHSHKILNPQISDMHCLLIPGWKCTQTGEL